MGTDPISPRKLGPSLLLAGPVAPWAKLVPEIAVPRLALGLLWLPISLHAAEVGVLVESGMVRYSVQPTLRPERLPELLAAHGIDAEAVSVGELLDPARLARLRVVVLPYGNAFPLPLYEPLRAWHNAGGGLVVCGIPFCHPCLPELPAGWHLDGDREANPVTWLDQGHGAARAVRLDKRRGGWFGVTSEPLPARAGERFVITGWVRSGAVEAGRDQLFVRFFAGGRYLAQDGPAVPGEAREWTRISREVTAPAECDRIDVSLQIWSAEARIELSDVHLARADQPAANLLANGGLTLPGDEWRDLGHDGRYFAPEAMATGSFGGGSGTVRLVEGNPLGLRADMLAPYPAQLQWLEAGSLLPGARVSPLVVLDTGDAERPLSALIEQPFGARDVWMGQVAADMAAPDRYFLDQLLVRGVAWSLGRADAVRTTLDALPRPEPLPDQIEIVDEPRPFADSFFPKSPPPARQLVAVDCRGMDRAERLAYISLQGLTSRTQPRLWLYFNDWDPLWLEQHRERGHVDGYTVAADPRVLFTRFSEAYRGAVIADPALYQGDLLAATLAGLGDLIVATPELAARLGLEVKLDLRGRFASYAEGLAWLWQTYRDRLCHHALSYSHPDVLATGSCDYEIAHRALLFWISGEKDGDRPGADPVAEADVMARILAALPPNIGMRGFPWHGDGVGMGEGGGVEFCGSYGKGLVCCNLSANMSVTSGVRVERLRPPLPAVPLRFEPDKVYIALTMSDGDNLNTWLHYFRAYFEHPRHGSIPIGWGMGPAILDLMPGVAQWYYDHATEADEFLADVSGVFYVFPETYARRYREREAVFDAYARWTAEYMARTHMNTVRPHGGSRETIARLAAGIPLADSIFADYARRLPYSEAVWRLPDGRPVFHAVTHWQHGRNGLLQDIREQVGDVRPAFVNAFLHNWTFDMDALAAAVDGKDEDMIFVTPSQLVDLYRQAVEAGAVQ